MFKLLIRILIILLAVPAAILAQGTIFGQVANSDLTTPANGDIKFTGFLDNTDNEIRIEISIGAGYDNGNWYDDFQNYLSEAPGNPFNFHFVNTANNESYILSGLIPNNSFQQVNVQLADNPFPQMPTQFAGDPQLDSTVRLVWEYNPDYTYRIYRRDYQSEGSFFRVDDPTGNMANDGIADSVYYDISTDNISLYEYLVIPTNNGQFGAHSEIIAVSSIPDGTWICGDVNFSGGVNLLDITYLIRYLYQGGAPPQPPASGDVNSSGGINILDITYIVYFLYTGSEAPYCPE